MSFTERFREWAYLSDCRPYSYATLAPVRTLWTQFGLHEEFPE